MLPDQGAPRRTHEEPEPASPTLTRLWKSGAHGAGQSWLLQGQRGPHASLPPLGLGPLRPPLSLRSLALPQWSPGVKGGQHLVSTWGKHCGLGSCGAAGCLPRRTRGWAWGRGLCSQSRDCWALAKRLGPTRGQGPGCGQQTPGDTQHLCHLRRSRSKLAGGEQQAEGHGAWQSRPPSAASPGSLPAVPPCTGKHVLSLLQAVTSHRQRHGAPRTPAPRHPGLRMVKH